MLQAFYFYPELDTLMLQVTKNLMQSLILQFTELKCYFFAAFLGCFVKLREFYF